MLSGIREIRLHYCAELAFLIEWITIKHCLNHSFGFCKLHNNRFLRTKWIGGVKTIHSTCIVTKYYAFTFSAILNS